MSNSFFPLALSLLWSILTPLPAEEQPYTMIEDKMNLEILTPSFKGRETRKIRLANGLQAYLISDPEANKSAAALAVGVGNWSDPVEHPGMAHFCEHLLFLGTEKYPEESGYDRYLKENGGTFNAYTTVEHTNYMFSIDHVAYPEALDRFSWFFKAPLFNLSGVDREVNAIDQEYAKNVEIDAVRELYIFKELANPDHPYRRFTMGNKKSLANTTPEHLKVWHRHHYSSDLMTLVLYSKLPVDEMEKMTAENFAAIPNTGAQKLHLDQPILTPEVQGKALYISPIKDIRTLAITWELPTKFALMMDTKPDDMVAYVLGHEGEKSLLAQLKSEGLAEGLYAGGYRLGFDQFMFRINVTLTEEGLADPWRVLQRVYEAIARLKQDGVPEHVFKEVKRMAEIHYQYQSREDAMATVTRHARNLLYEDLSTYPMLTLIAQRFDPEATRELLSYLTPEKGVLDITAKPEVSGVQPDRREEWIGGEYAVKEQSPELLAQLEQAAPTPEIQIPAPNPFIPEKLVVKGTREASNGIPHPELVAEGDYGQLYFLKDLRYLVPEITWEFTIKTPAIHPGDPKKMVLTDLYVRAVKEDLNRLSYPATVAGLNFDICPDRDGIKITIKGYDDKADVLFAEILKKLKTVSPSDQEFEIYKASLARKYRNFLKESPLAQGVHTLKRIIYQDFVSHPEKANAIRSITKEDLMSFIPAVYERYYVQGIMAGNKDRDFSLAVWNNLQNTFAGQPFPTSEHVKEKVIALPDQDGPYFVTEKVQAPGNAAILMVEHAPFTFESRAAQQVLAKAINEPFYTALRTKQQTGYIVFSWEQEIEKRLFSYFAVQSNTHEGRDLLARFELLIESFLQELGKEAEFSEERFETVKQAQITALKLPPKNLGEMTDLLNLLAFDYDGDFDWLEKRVEGFDHLDFQTFIKYAYQFLGRTNKQRVAVLMEGRLPEENRFAYENAHSLRKLRQKSHFVAKDENSR